MANNASGASGKLVYPWNPFQDLTSNDIKGEIAHVSASPQGAIIIPRCAPLFSRNVSITLQGSTRPLSLEMGEYSFLYPFGEFTDKYSRLAFGGILIHNVTQPSNFLMDYSTIGADFVLDDIAYAEAVANVLTSPRRADWSQLVNVPSEWPSDPHPHPASDTYNYQDMITALKSYIDALLNTGNPASLQSQLENHLKAELQQAHKGTLSDLGVKNLKDWGMAGTTDIQGESTELLVNVNICKQLIRQFDQGGWK